MIDYSQMSTACQAGGQAQDYSIRKQMWDDIQVLKAAVQVLQSQVNDLKKGGINDTRGYRTNLRHG